MGPCYCLCEYPLHACPTCFGAEERRADEAEAIANQAMAEGRSWIRILQMSLCELEHDYMAANKHREALLGRLASLRDKYIDARENVLNCPELSDEEREELRSECSQLSRAVEQLRSAGPPEQGV